MIRKLLQYAPVQIFSALSLFILIALHTKYLSLSEYGVLAIFMLINEVIRSFSAQWINSSLLRLYPGQALHKRRDFLNSSIFIIGVLFIPAALLLGVVIFFYDLFSFKTFLYLTILLMVKIVYLFFLDVNRLDEKLNKYRLASLIQAFSAVLFTFFLLRFTPLIERAVGALILSYIVALPFLLINIKIRFPIDKESTKEIVSYGTPLMISGLMAVLASRVDRLFIADVLSLAETGVYSGISNLLLGIMALVFMVVAMPLYPELTRAIGDTSKLKLLHGRYLNMLMLISLPSFVGLCFLAEPLITMFLTPAYLEYGVELFYILAFSAFLLNVRGHYTDHGLQFTLNTKLMPVITGVALIFNILVLYLTLDQFGVYAAAWTSLLTSVLSLFLSIIFSVRKGYKYSVPIDFFKVILSCGVMAFSLYLAKQYIEAYEMIVQLCVLMLIGVVSYFVANVIFDTCKIRTRFLQVSNK